MPLVIGVRHFALITLQFVHFPIFQIIFLPSQNQLFYPHHLDFQPSLNLNFSLDLHSHYYEFLQVILLLSHTITCSWEYSILMGFAHLILAP